MSVNQSKSYRAEGGPEAVKVKLRLFAAGCCTHPEWVTLQGGSLRSSRIPAIFACIEHPRLGVILVDTGYSAEFRKETRRLPARLYRWITPVTFEEKDRAVHQLGACGMTAEQVQSIIITHFHADHIAGLKDFPSARFLYLPEAYDAVKRLQGLSALRRAFLPGLLPERFEQRSALIDRDRQVKLHADVPFPYALDVLGDGSLLAVDLPGHADGQIGLFLSTEQHDYFLCADAAWSSRAIRENRPPHAAAEVIMPSREQYRDSFGRLVELHRCRPELRIVPSHCPEVWANWTAEGGQL
ncbi:MBL fold metallo-hydrolase [Paenibacillus sp. y28]|uniref:MBL fold metallo-hydrolase n=1 Tax=Paenibacillus sp. y28 TaxID=3129110 RepID=UPI0030170F6B